MFMKRKNTVVLCLFALVLLCLPFTKALAASSLKLYIYGKKENITYTGKQVKYNYNGKSISTSTPGIIMNDTSLAPYVEVFVQSAMKVKSKYNKSNGTVTLWKDKNTIVFTLGSKKAKVNGKTVALDTAPISVNFKDKKVTKILVPARFVAETFGYVYVWNSVSSTASITKPMNLYYNNKNVAYTGTQGQVTVDGIKVNVNAMPSIIIKDTAMVQAWRVFSQSSIGAGYKYNASSKELTLTLENKTVVLTMGSTTALVNGRARIMDTAPLLVQNRDTNTSVVMVPGSFVTSYLGYDYNWNSTLKTSVITSRKAEDNSNQDEIDGPELGGDQTWKDVVAFNWGMKPEYLNEYLAINNVISTTEIVNEESDSTGSTANIYNIIKDPIIANNKEIYLLQSTTPFSKATISVQDQILTIHSDNTVTGNVTYYHSGNMVGTITTKDDTTNSTANISFPLLHSNMKYELTLSADKCTAYVTLYRNYLSNVTIGTDSGNDYILLTGMNGLNVNVTEDRNSLSLNITNTMNGIGDNYAATSSLRSIKAVTSTEISGNAIDILIEKSDTSEYVITETGNNYKISFIENQIDTPIGDNADYDVWIKLPNGVNYSAVKHEDQYYNNQFIITIPGDYRNFFASNPLLIASTIVSNSSITYNGSVTKICIKTTKLQGYRLENCNGSIGVTIGNPRTIYKNIVVLDAGHGGTDVGANYFLNKVSIYEKDINFNIMYTLMQKYFEDSNIKAYYSRYTDFKVPLYDRAAFAKQVEADFFVSLHMNANSKTTVKGTMVYYSIKNNSKASTGLSSEKLARIFLDYIPTKVGTVKRDISDGNFVVVRENTVPAILVELAFMSNQDDLALMTNGAFQEKSAKAIYDAVCITFEKYPTGR